jgi:predicted Zn-dependent protease
MAKTLKVFFLLIVILLSFAFVILKILANGSPDNFFNSSFRKDFAKIHALRQILGLHFDGDGLSDYLGPKNSKISIEVDSMDGLEVPIPSLELLSKRISSATGKSVSYYISDTKIPFQASVNQTQISQIADKYQNYITKLGSAFIYLLYANQMEGETERLGSTYKEFGVVIFAGTIRDFAGNNPEILNNYIESTSLHEFGHQIGLNHNDQSGCLMNASVEEAPVQSNPQIVTDFCDYEKNLIKSSK